MIAELLYKQQDFRCALANLLAMHSGVGVCEGLLEIDHINGDPLDWRGENLRLLCKTHNLSERSRRPAQRSTYSVSVYNAGEEKREVAPRWTSNEGARHDYQRPKFNRWLYDPTTGIAPPGTIFHPKGLAKAAVHGVGLIQGKLGSSVTYERYVEEDINGGFWEPTNDGSDNIERTKKPFLFE